MKKLFTSLMVLAAAFSASAQVFTVAGIDDVTYSDGDEVKVGYTEGRRPGVYNWDPELIAHIGDKAATLKVTVSASAEQTVQFCGLDGACAILGENKPTTKEKWYAASNIVPLEIDIKNAPMLAEPVTADVELSAGDQTMKLKVIFTTEPQAGIESATVAPNSVKIAGRTLNYVADAAGRLNIYNISGRNVINRAVTAGSGSVNLAGLPAGVYVYRLGTHTGKILLR